MERDSMIFYKSFMEATDDLEPELYKTVIKMVLHYAMEGKEPEGDTISKAFFSLITEGMQMVSKVEESQTKTKPK